MTCQLSTSATKAKKAVEHVIELVKTTGRRSVLVVPLAGGSSLTLNRAVEKAVKENIVVVTSAGKKSIMLTVDLHQILIHWLY